MNRSRSRNDHTEIWLNRPTCDHFARIVPDLAELDPAWQAKVQAALHSSESIQFLISVPFQGKFRRNLSKISQIFKRSQAWELTPDWVMLLTERRLILVHDVELGGALQTTPIDLESILEIQCGTVLLFAWFNVQWVEKGLVRQESILFNAVGEPIFTRLTALIRSRMDPTPPYEDSSDGRSRNLLESLPYKFMNIIPKRGLLTGEPVRNMLYRPARWKHWLGIFKRMSVAQAVVLLTPHAVLIAEEDCAAGQCQYGFINTVYPRRLIRRTWTTQTEDVSSLLFSLEWQGGTIIKQVDFAPEAQETLAVFAGQVLLR